MVLLTAPPAITIEEIRAKVAAFQEPAHGWRQEIMGNPPPPEPCMHRGTLGAYSNDGSQCSTCGAFVPFVKP